jgi:hypothetical protein
VSALWQVQSRHFGPLGRVDLVSRGPVAASPEDLDDWPDRFRHWHDGRPMILNADGLSPAVLRDGGFWPLLTPATLGLLRLTDPRTMRAAMHQKWRNRLNRALRCDLKITRKPLLPGHWLLATEAKQSREKGYRGLPPGVSLAFAKANPGAALVFEARHKGQPVAAALMLRHGRMATWQIGASNPEGRALNAMNLILWEAMVYLRDAGHDLLDLGTLNVQDAPGLAHFKMGTGAELHRLGGTWLYIDGLARVARHLPQALAA